MAVGEGERRSVRAAAARAFPSAGRALRAGKRATSLAASVAGELNSPKSRFILGGNGASRLVPAAHTTCSTKCPQDAWRLAPYPSWRPVVAASSGSSAGDPRSGINGKESTPRLSGGTVRITSRWME